MKKGNAYMFICRGGHKIRAVYADTEVFGRKWFIKVNALTYDNRLETEPEFINPLQVIRIYPIPYEK